MALKKTSMTVILNALTLKNVAKNLLQSIVFILLSRRFYITYLDDENPIESLSFDLYNPLNLMREIENIIKTKGETYLLQDLFEKQQPTIFMNVIFYFNLIQVPFFFMCSKVNHIIFFLYNPENRCKKRIIIKIFKTWIKK